MCGRINTKSVVGKLHAFFKRLWRFENVQWVGAQAVWLISSLSSTLRVLWVPLAVAGFGYFVFSVPDQVQEIYLILATDTAESWVKITALALTVGLLCLSINQCVLLTWNWDSEDEVSRSKILFARVVAVLPLFGIASGLHKAAGYFNFTDLQAVLTKLSETPLSSEGTEYFDALTSHFPHLHDDALHSIEVLKGTAVGCAVMALGYIIVGFAIGKRFEPAAWFRVLQKRIFFLTAALVVACSLQTSLYPRVVSSSLLGLSSALGTLFWLALFLVVLLAFVSRLELISKRVGISLVGILVLTALLSDWFSLNDNHTVRTIPLVGNAEVVGGLVTTEFDDWWQKRPKERVQVYRQLGRPFPVYIVAARGGGLYAAYQASIALARLYDRCPAIIDHIFIVSGVSGGSLGAAAFSAAVKALPAADRATCSFSKPTPPGSVESLLDHFFSSDLLSPLAASALFPDFAQRFIPYPIPAFDRARAFERAIEEAWVDATSGRSDAFSRGIVQDRTIPLLYMNVTQAETGEQHVVAPTTDDIQWNRSTVTSAYQELGIELNSDIALSTAAVLSSRFPLILPPASVEGEGWIWPRIATRFVDGGYFENSGADTATNLINGLEAESPAKILRSRKTSHRPRSVKEYPEYVLKMIVLGSYAYDARLYEGTEFQANSFSELMTPLDAFMNTREVRGDQAVQRASDLFDVPPALKGESRRVYRLNLNHRYFKFPLGWQLSSTTRKLIAANLAEAGACNYPGRGGLSGFLDGPNGRPGGTVGFVESFQANACMQCRILKDVAAGVKLEKQKAKSKKESNYCD